MRHTFFNHTTLGVTETTIATLLSGMFVLHWVIKLELTSGRLINTVCSHVPICQHVVHTNNFHDQFVLDINGVAKKLCVAKVALGLSVIEQLFS